MGIVFNDDLSVKRIGKDGVADKAELRPGDKFLEIYGTKITSCEQVIDIYANSANKKVPIKFERNGKVRKVNLKPSSQSFEFNADVFNKIDEILACGRSLNLLPIVTEVSYDTEPKVYLATIKDPEQRRKYAAAIAEQDISSKKLGGLLKDQASSDLLNYFSWVPNFKIINRDLSSAVLQELKFQQSGVVSPKSSRKIGQLTGASHLLLLKSFTQTAAGGEWHITSELIDVENGETLAVTKQVQNLKGTPEVPSIGVDREPQGMNISSKKSGVLIIYADKDSNLNHYVPSGWMGDYDDLKMNQGWENGQNGTCIRIKYTPYQSQGAGWAGIYWQHPANNWGDKRGGYNLSSYSKLTLWARSANGGEIIDKFFVGGIIGQTERGDSDEASLTPVTLSQEWTKYEIPLNGLDLSHIIGGFGFAVNSKANPNGFTMFLDNIYFESGD